ncbi:MAG: non-ribosomal peptide synthetase, partial [Candidatus Aminicenantes bacterium]|nr:non-ribosomal peptide synthetase [Candidatus Aminicenantes bacterium]
NRILSSILENPLQKLWEIEIISPEEKKKILFDFNNTGVEYPTDKTIPELFETQVEKSPDHIAIVEVIHEWPHQLTYRQLNNQSGGLACSLVQQGVGDGGNVLVGLMMNRSIDMITGILGITKVGCAYVPLNPKAPATRSKYILCECRAKILVATRRLYEDSENMGRWEGEVIFLENVPPAITSHSPFPIPNAIPSNFAYVIFTSGSTGEPKGVPITHANLSPLLDWGYRSLEFGVKDRFLQNLSYYFDWSVWEIVIGITTGASLYMVPDELLLNPHACAAFMNRNNITVLHITPTHYRYFLNASGTPRMLRYLFLGAEKLSRELVQQAFASVHQDCRVFNMYGPTECTIISAVLEIQRTDVEKFENLSSVPIGGPVGNTGLFVLDKYLNHCPLNVVGELYIAGDGVGSGYLNNPELTLEKFIDFHHSSFDLPRIHHSKLYRTGDLARRLADGNIEFLGRLDHQVKIRGFRIEPGEIESRLGAHEKVKEAVVIDRERENGERYLCAYFVPAGGAVETFDIELLREYLARVFPDYMIPAFFAALEKIPLNPNGKLDRKALPDPGSTGLLSGNDYVLPRTAVEKLIGEIWREVLGIEKIGIDDKFFSVGGNSLNLIRMNARLDQELGIEIPGVIIFQYPTIRMLAQYLSREEKASEIDRKAKVEEGKNRRLQKIQKRRSLK